jgi:3-methyladenine DNA glycosylase Tag
MKSFSRIYKRASKRKGGDNALEALLPEAKPQGALIGHPDAYFLSTMTKRVFQAGFVWRVVEAKWPGFEAAFFNFDPSKLMSLSEAEWEAYGQDARIIRNLQKVYALRHNVFYVNEISVQHDSYGEFLTNWPSDNQIGLLAHLKKSAKRLGGMTGSYFLSTVGKDCFLMTQDVIACLQNEGLEISANPTSQKDLQKVQEAMNTFQAETGLPYRHLSAIMAYSVGENRHRS